MAASVKRLAKQCLNKSRNLSIRRDVLGVYGSDNPRSRSLKKRLELLRTTPFIRVAVVAITNGPAGVNGPDSLLQRDLDDANAIYQGCGIWIYCAGAVTEEDPSLDNIQIHDCSVPHHVSSPQEFALFGLGRNLGAKIVAYYVTGQLASPTTQGCAAHPDGLKGFWMRRSALRYTFAHELGHVVAFSAGRFNLTGHSPDSNNVMFASGGWTSQPSFNSSDCAVLVVDEDVERCPG